MERYTSSIGNSNTGESASKLARFLTPIAIIAFLAYALATFILKSDIYYVAIAGLAFLAAMILSHRFELGLFIFALIAPFNLGGSPAVLGASASYQAGLMPSQIGIVLLCAFWAVSYFLGRERKLDRTKLDAPMLVFFGVAIASSICASFIWDPEVTHYDKQILFHVSEIGMWALCAAAFYLTANAGKRAEWLTALFWPVAFIGLYVAACQFAGIDLPWRITRAGFMPAFAAIMAAARLFFTKDRPIVRFIVIAVFLINMASVFVSRDWVSGWLTASLGVLIVLFMYSKKLFAALAVVMLIALIVMPTFMSSVYTKSKQEGDMDRFTIWRDSINMAAHINPVLGIGPADYLTYSRKYASVWYGNTTYTNAHSTFAQVVAEMGLLGICALIWLITAGVKTGTKSIQEIRPDRKWFAVGATSVFGAIAITSLVGDYIFPSRVNGAVWTFGTSLYPWLLLGASVALARLNRDEAELEPIDAEYQTYTNNTWR